MGFGTLAACGGEKDRREYATREVPNFIVIPTDDQRYDYLGCTGNPFIRTPDIDSLATEGVPFTQAYMTSPLCMPSRSCLFTGQYTRRHGIDFSSNQSMTMADWARTYPMILKQNGYYTGYIGKNHVPHSAGTRSMEQRLTDPELYRSAYRDIREELPMVENYIETGGSPPLLPDEMVPEDYGHKSYDYAKKKKPCRSRWSG